MSRLIAVYPVLFECKQYKPGDELPTHNAGFVEAWTENGAAEWREDAEEPKKVVKAKRVTAEPGLPGDAYPATGSEPDLIGKVPSKKARGAQPEPAKRRRKSSE